LRRQQADIPTKRADPKPHTQSVASASCCAGVTAACVHHEWAGATLGPPDKDTNAAGRQQLVAGIRSPHENTRMESCGGHSLQGVGNVSPRRCHNGGATCRCLPLNFFCTCSLRLYALSALQTMWQQVSLSCTPSACRPSQDLAEGPELSCSLEASRLGTHVVSTSAPN